MRSLISKGCITAALPPSAHAQDGGIARPTSIVSDPDTPFLDLAH
jgi:hypothetical protein